jgi:hypothetical protein
VLNSGVLSFGREKLFDNFVILKLFKPFKFSTILKRQKNLLGRPIGAEALEREAVSTGAPKTLSPSRDDLTTEC